MTRDRAVSDTALDRWPFVAGLLIGAALVSAFWNTAIRYFPDQVREVIDEYDG